MAFTSANDINILQSSDAAVVGAGAGNDTYVLSPSTLSANQEVTISDTQGSNKLQLIGGLTIASSTVASNAVLLTLSNGAKVTVLGADTFSYEVGGNPLTATAGTVQTYAQFATTTLGAASVPTTGTVSGTANVTIAGSTGGGAGQTITLTTGTDTKALTAGNDTVDGATTVDSFGADTIIDTSTTDTDTLNAVVTGTVTPAMLTSVENVNITAKYGSATLAGTNVTGVKSLVFDSSIASGTATVTNAGAASIAAVKAGTNIASLSVTNSATGGAVSVDGGSASAVTVDGGAGADTFTVALSASAASVSVAGGGNTDTITLNLKGGALALAGHATDIETLNLVGSTAASTITLTNGIATTATVVSGDQNVTLSAADTIFAGKTITNSLAAGKTLTATVTGTAGTADLSKVGANTFDLQGTGNSGVYTLGNNANVKVNGAGNTTFTAGTGATVLNLDVALAAVGVLTNSTFTTVNVTANTVDVTTALDAQVGTSATLKLSGSKNVSVANTATYKSLDASSLTGVLTIADLGSAGQLNTTGGSGNDSLTLGTVTAATTVNGGAGNDTIVVANTTGDFALTLDAGAGTDTLSITGTANFNQTNLKTSVVTGFETISIGANTVTLTQKQLFTNGNAFTLSGAGGTLNIVDDAVSSKVFDLSGIQLQAGVAQPAITITGSASANQITGSSVNDSLVGGAAADTINGGAGNDSITGAGGADVINVGAGTDTIVMGGTGQTYSAATAATIVSGTTVLTGIDKVTGMAAGDKIDLSAILNTYTGAAGTTIASASGTTVALVRGNFADATNVFTTDAAGTSTLFVYDADGAGAGTAVEAIVLVGTVLSAAPGTAATGVVTLA